MKLEFNILYASYFTRKEHLHSDRKALEYIKRFALRSGGNTIWSSKKHQKIFGDSCVCLETLLSGNARCYQDAKIVNLNDIETKIKEFIESVTNLMSSMTKDRSYFINFSVSDFNGRKKDGGLEIKIKEGTEGTRVITFLGIEDVRKKKQLKSNAER